MNADGRLGRLARRRDPGIRPRDPGARGGDPAIRRALLRSLRAATLRRLSPRAVAILVAVVALLVGGWLWLRDSSLVSVQRVAITGVSGPDADQIRSALVAAAHNMTTLDVQIGKLRAAVAPYPVVKDLRVSTQFPHGMRIHVIEQIPVAAVSVDGHRTAVAADGTLLHDVVATAQLPVIPLRVPPGGSRLTDPAARGAVAVLAAAPYQMLLVLTQVSTVAPRGLVAQLRSGPSIYFGDAGRLTAKWAAAVAVLAASNSVGASYIDVTDPARPAAGVPPSGSAATGSAPAGSGTAPTDSGAATAGGGAVPAGGGSVSASSGTTPSTGG